MEITRILGFLPHPDTVHGPQLTSSWVSEADHAEVRRWTSPKPEGAQWHQDGDTTPGASMNCGIIFWANTLPTEFRVGSEVFRPEPFRVVLVNNLECMHRRPLEATGKRWVFRQRVQL